MDDSSKVFEVESGDVSESKDSALEEESFEFINLAKKKDSLIGVNLSFKNLPAGLTNPTSAREISKK